MRRRDHSSRGLRCVVMCDLETSIMRRPWPTEGCRARNKQVAVTVHRYCDKFSGNATSRDISRKIDVVRLSETFRSDFFV